MAMLASAAQGAARIRAYRADASAGGTITLKIVFKNTRSEPKLFTPRRVARVGFESVPLTCANNPGDPASEGLLTRSLRADIPVQPAGAPGASKPKGRYRFIFAASLPATGSISGKIDKPDKRRRGTPPRVRGRFTIAGADLGPGTTNCDTNGSPDWSAPRPEKD